MSRRKAMTVEEADNGFIIEGITIDGVIKKSVYMGWNWHEVVRFLETNFGIQEGPDEDGRLTSDD